ncbi:Golgi to ER traffic protein 4-like [Papilio machaon]|uniref:Golgi to ER traffic protein 4-like n=1 Tax=Papilio machaon TaxID=76193 RepID=A0A194QRP1_PAPMA|nr:Golgi to ER traffic protein 4-like [Papilio machaon]
MATRGERGVSRVLEKLEASVNAGQYYEAHQMYRTLYFRYLSQKKYEHLFKLLYEGSTLLLLRDQQGSGADLAILLVDVLNKSETKPSEEWIEKIAKLFELMHSGIPERDTYLTNAVKWSMDNSKKGHPLLHQKIAEVYWKEKRYPAAHKHFLHSSNGTVYANMLIELQTTRGLKAEIDLFIAQAVLQFLCLKNIQMARDTFKKYTSLHPSIRNDVGPPYSFPLLNFLWFLLQSIEQKNTVQYEILRKCYDISLKRDSNYSDYLENIGRVWFGIDNRKNNKNQNSMFGGLLKTIIGDLDSSDDEGENQSSKPTAPELD